MGLWVFAGLIWALWGKLYILTMLKAHGLLSDSSRYMYIHMYA